MKNLLALLSLCFFSGYLFATPAQVVLLRHGEKDLTGDNLSKRGFERASALVPYFTKNPAPVLIDQAVAIYAQPASKNHSSKRPVQTITPLAIELGLPVLVGYTRERYDKMCAEILQKPEYDNKLVFICWSHDNLSAIATCLGVQGLSDWPGSQYDRVGIISYSLDGTVSFQDLPQKLLFNDSIL
jgi:hypothetical protein